MTRSAVCHLLNLALNHNISGKGAIELKKPILDLSISCQSVLADLDSHGIAPLIASRLENSDLREWVSPRFWEKIQATSRQTRILNTFLFLTVSQILKSLEEANLHPIVGTNLVLADSCYGDLAERSLKSIDLLLSLDEILKAKAILKSLGFKSSVRLPGSYRFHLINGLGITCHLQGCKAQDLRDLTVNIQPQQLQRPSFTILEPNAMLAELVAEIGDRPLSDLPLQRAADLALFLQKWGHLVDRECLQVLMPRSDRWQSLWRAIRFLETQLSQEIPACLSQGAANADLRETMETSRMQHLFGVSSSASRDNLVFPRMKKACIEFA